MLRVLIVDDDPQFQTLASEVLKRKLGVEIELAHSGNHAINLLAQGHRFEFIISDYDMPDGDGASIFNFLRKNKIFAFFILFTSAEDTAALRNQFPGKTFLGVIPKSKAKDLCDLVIQAATSWQP